MMDAKTRRIVENLLKKTLEVLEKGEKRGTLICFPDLSTPSMIPEGREVLKKYEGLPNTSVMRESLLKEICSVHVPEDK
jgi:hypothetical protein